MLVWVFGIVSVNILLLKEECVRTQIIKIKYRKKYTAASKLSARFEQTINTQPHKKGQHSIILLQKMK